MTWILCSLHDLNNVLQLIPSSTRNTLEQLRMTTKIVTKQQMSLPEITCQLHHMQVIMLFLQWFTFVEIKGWRKSMGENMTIMVNLIFWILVFLAMLWTALLIIIASLLSAIRVELEQLRLLYEKGRR